MPAATKPAKTFADLETALDVLDGADLSDKLQDANDAIGTAASVETIEDFKGNLEEAAAKLRAALATIERLIARC